MAMKAMKGRFLKKLNLISAIKRGLAHEQLCSPGDEISTQDDSVPGLLPGAKCLEDDDQEDDFSSSLESVQDLEDVDLSAPESLEFSLSGGEVSSDCESETLPQVEDSCPPGRGDASSVIFYSTSLRGVRKTFDDCSRVRFLLRSLRVRFEEKDISMHKGYRDELWKVSGEERAVPPKLFIRGRLIGGADEVIGLHERGELRELLQGIPLDSSTSSCTQCGNFRFVICSNCSGSCRVVADAEKRIKCTECNENGLVKCPTC